MPSPLSRGLRPSRRDLLLVLLTFGVAWLFFASPSTPASPGRSDIYAESSRSSRLGSLTGLLRGGKGGYDGAAGEGAVTYTESVKKVGFKADSSEDVDPEQFAHLNTKMLGHTPGWTMFEKLYLFNGQLYVVT